MSEEVSIPDPEDLTTKILSEAIRHSEMGMALLEKHDRDFERSSKVNSGIVKHMPVIQKFIQRKKGSLACKPL
jgi:hypothetical protein